MSRRNRKKRQADPFEQLTARIGQLDRATFRRFWQQLPAFHRRALMVLVPVVIVLLLIPLPDKRSPQPEPVSAERVAVSVNTSGLSQQADTEAPVVAGRGWQEYQIQAGDTLAKVFRSNQLPMSDLNALVAIEGLDKPLSKISQGQMIRFKRNREGDLDILQLEKPGSAAVMFVRLADGGFSRSN